MAFDILYRPLSGLENKKQILLDFRIKTQDAWTLKNKKEAKAFFRTNIPPTEGVWIYAEHNINIFDIIRFNCHKTNYWYI